MQLLTLLCKYLKRFRAKHQRFKIERVTELPDVLNARKIYVAGEGGYLWFAAMMCPCGCGEVLYMNLNPQSRPLWRVEIHRDHTVSLFPSVNRTVGCHSHFYVRKGEVQWCRPLRLSCQSTKQLSGYTEREVPR